jgi:hypothetical protein
LQRSVPTTAAFVVRDTPRKGHESESSSHALRVAAAAPDLTVTLGDGATALDPEVVVRATRGRTHAWRRAPCRPAGLRRGARSLLRRNRRSTAEGAQYVCEGAGGAADRDNSEALVDPALDVGGGRRYRHRHAELLRDS